MIKKIGILLAILVIGLMMSIFTEAYLREWIQYLFKISTTNAIQFVGKNFHLFASSFYYASFGVWAVLFWIAVKAERIQQRFIYALLTINLFFLAIIICSYVNSHLMIAQCTACTDGIRRIHYNDIDYEGTILFSLMISIFPIGGRRIKKA